MKELRDLKDLTIHDVQPTSDEEILSLSLFVLKQTGVGFSAFPIQSKRLTCENYFTGTETHLREVVDCSALGFLGFGYKARVRKIWCYSVGVGSGDRIHLKKARKSG